MDNKNGKEFSAKPSTFPHSTFSSWAVMSSRLKLEARAGFPWCPVAALMVPAGDALVLLLLLLAPLLPPPPLTLLLLLPLPPPPPLLPPPGCGLLLRPAGGFWRTWRPKCVLIFVSIQQYKKIGDDTTGMRLKCSLLSTLQTHLDLRVNWAAFYLFFLSLKLKAVWDLHVSNTESLWSFGHAFCAPLCRSAPGGPCCCWVYCWWCWALVQWRRDQP